MGDEAAVTNDRERRELEILNKVLADLQSLDPDGRHRVLQTVSTYYHFYPTSQPSPSLPRDTLAESAGPFSEDRSIPPKNFVMQKQPQTDVERVACLAYYLTHYRDTPHFNTLDISKLNTEAAQLKFSNATVSVNNAMKMGYLVPATKGNKQLSAAGEQFVFRLPDREAAKLAMSAARPRRKTRKANQAAEFPSNESEGENQ